MNNEISLRYRASRHGYTMIEVMATLSILLMIGLAAASMLGTITSVGLKGTANSQARADVARFAQHFRRDVRLANEIEVTQASDSIDLKMNGFVIRYRVRAETNQLTREHIGSPDKAYERYQLTNACQPAFFTDAEFVTARVTSPGASVPWLVEVMRP